MCLSHQALGLMYKRTLFCFAILCELIGAGERTLTTNEPLRRGSALQRVVAELTREEDNSKSTSWFICIDIIIIFLYKIVIEREREIERWSYKHS